MNNIAAIRVTWYSFIGWKYLDIINKWRDFHFKKADVDYMTVPQGREADPVPDALHPTV